MKPYEKTKQDESREESDLKNNAIMRWLQNQDAFKFNPGDIIIKKTKSYNYNPHNRERSEEWVTEVITKATGAAKKYVYAFENKLGIGYLRQLKANGTGYCGSLICVANFDPENTRFELDPDFLDHTLLGEGEFTYNNEYVTKKKFREEAMAANKKIMVRTSSIKILKEWYLGLKVGDTFWYGQTFDDFAAVKWEVVKINTKDPYRPTTSGYMGKSEYANQSLGADEWRTIEAKIVENNGGNTYFYPGSTKTLQMGTFSWAKVSMTRPHPMKDQLCGPQK